MAIGIINFAKHFSKFYRRYYELISKFQIGHKSLLSQGLSEPEFYGDFVYNLKKIVGCNNFSAQVIKIIYVVNCVIISFASHICCHTYFYNHSRHLFCQVTSSLCLISKL